VNVFVAGFIGSPAMNLLKGHIKAGAKPSFITQDGVSLPLAKAPKSVDGLAAIYGIRPEHIELGGKALKAEVTVVEPLGSETQLFGKIGSQRFVGLFRKRMSATPGENIAISPDPTLVHLFDAASGKRL
jgi:multiple sugar transport system ATP-binding protein